MADGARADLTLPGTWPSSFFFPHKRGQRSPGAGCLSKTGGASNGKGRRQEVEQEDETKMMWLLSVGANARA